MVYHEYTHGLSNRLVVDANGNSTLGNVQAGSMGEAWSDWYAMDYLVNQGQLVDTNASGELRVGDYVGAGKDLIRTQPLDCAVGSTSAKCPGLPGKTGGYTYGDFGVIAGGPEVHADGEIWGETLWDLRTRIGSSAAESLITRAMELSPANPSYLDMRNSILQADAVQGGKRNAAIWSVFANRGMGYFASALNGDDSTPFEDFSLPPAAGSPKGAITGKVTDDASKAALAGAVVSIGGHASSPGFSEYLAATTDANGRLPDPRRLLRHLPRRLRHQVRLRLRGGDRDGAGAGHDEELRPSPRLGGQQRRRQRGRVQRARLHPLRVRPRLGDRPVARQRVGQHVGRPRRRPE